MKCIGEVGVSVDVGRECLELLEGLVFVERGGTVMEGDVGGMRL